MEQVGAADADQKYLAYGGSSGATTTNTKPRQRSRRKINEAEDDASKRRCVSTACIACRYATVTCVLFKAFLTHATYSGQCNG